MLFCIVFLQNYPRFLAFQNLNMSSSMCIVVGDEINTINISPGENESINLSLFNLGENGQFLIIVSTSNNSGLIFYDITPNITIISQNSSVAIEMLITTAEDIAENEVVTFTVIAQSVLNNGISNFIEIDVTIISLLSIPPSEFVSITFESKWASLLFAHKKKK